MKAAITYGKGHIRVIDVPRPEPGPYQSLCKILSCATCSGTDRKLMGGDFPVDMSYPGILGHESVGRVIENGNQVRYIQEGDLMLRPAAAYPGETLDDWNSLWGGFAEYGLVTDKQAFTEDHPEESWNPYTQFQQPVPEALDISPADATMLITLKEVYSFLAQLGVGMNSSVVVLGSGPVGMAFCFFAKLVGAYPVICLGRRDEPLEYCKRFAIDGTVNNSKENMNDKIVELTDGEKCDFVIDAVGNAGLLKESVGFLKEGGQVAPYATQYSMEYEFDRARGPGKWTTFFGGPLEDQARYSIEGLARLGVIPYDDFYDRRMSFDDIGEAFRLIEQKKAFKVVIDIAPDVE